MIYWTYFMGSIEVFIFTTVQLEKMNSCNDHTNTEIKEVIGEYLWEPLFSDPNKTLVERLKSKNCQFHLELLKYDFLTKKIVYFCYHISLTDAKKNLLFNVFLFKDCFGDWFSHFHQWNCIGKRDLWMAPILKSKPFFPLQIIYSIINELLFVMI